MGHNTVRSITGWIIISGHLGLALTAIVKLTPYLNGNQIIDVLLVLSPITLAYFTAVVRGFIGSKFQTTPGRRVNHSFAAVAILIPTVLVIILAYVFIRYPDGVANDVSSLQRWIAAIEVVLGTTVGMIVTDFFPTRNDSVS